jgi:hypothetical protein
MYRKQRVTIDCLTLCRALGAYRYNAALGESQRLAFRRRVGAEAMEGLLEALPESANSGDMYARLRISRNPPVAALCVDRSPKRK